MLRLELSPTTPLETQFRPSSIVPSAWPAWLLRLSTLPSSATSASHTSIAAEAVVGAYAASKGALSAMTRAMALELAQDDIRVNAVLPGAVDTEMLRAGLTRGQVEGSNAEHLLGELESKHAMGRVGRPEEIARAIWFFADNEQSSFITGQNLIVDGGATARLSTE